MDTFPFPEATKPLSGRDATLGMAGDVALNESLSLDLQMEEMQGFKERERALFVCLLFQLDGSLAAKVQTKATNRLARLSSCLFYDMICVRISQPLVAAHLVTQQFN